MKYYLSPLITQHYNCVMIPDFVSVSGTLWPLLPPGVHEATLTEFKYRYVYNIRRQKLYDGFLNGVSNLFSAGCLQIFIDGSFVTAKPEPNDYDLCWDIEHVQAALIDQVFTDFSNLRYNQKQKYGGEYFPITLLADPKQSFLGFFQTDKATGSEKGIIRIKNFIEMGGAVR